MCGSYQKLFLETETKGNLGNKDKDIQVFKLFQILIVQYLKNHTSYFIVASLQT